MISLLYSKWDQNAFTPIAAVNYDSLYNNEIKLIEKYMWNCGSCMFIAIQKIPHLNGTKVWNEVFSVFSSCLIPEHDETSDSDTMREIIST